MVKTTASMVSFGAKDTLSDSSKVLFVIRKHLTLLNVVGLILATGLNTTELVLYFRIDLRLG